MTVDLMGWKLDNYLAYPLRFEKTRCWWRKRLFMAVQFPGVLVRPVHPSLDMFGRNLLYWGKEKHFE